MEPSETKRQSIKQKFGDQELVSARHRDRAGVGIRKKRDRIIKRTRDAASSPVVVNDLTITNTESDIVRGIQSLNLEAFLSPQPEAQVTLLSAILARGVLAEPFYAPSELYPEHSKGPFLFTDDRIIQALIKYFAGGLEKAAECLTCISGHPQSLTWSMKLMTMGIIPVIMNHLRNPNASQTLKAAGFWIMGNIAIDHPSMRDEIINQGVIDVLLGHPRDDLAVLTEMVCCTRALYQYDPLPTPQQTKALWEGVIAHCIPTLPRGEDSIPTRCIVKMIQLMGRYGGEEYHKWLVSNGFLMTWLIDLGKANVQVPLIMDFFATLTRTMDIHRTMVEMGCITIFTGCLNNIDPIVRTEAGLGLSNLASNPSCVPLLATSDILTAVNIQFNNSDNWKISKQLYWFVTEMTLSCAKIGPQEGMTPLLFMVEHGLIRHLVELLSRASMEPLVLINGLRAIAMICQALPDQRDVLEELDGVTRIETLLSFNNPEVQKLAEMIIDSYFP